MRRLELAAASLAYEAVGTGQPLVFLHGVGSDRQTWAGQLERFGQTHLVVALDLRGHGQSQADPATISLERFAEDVATLIDRLGSGAAHVCGLSLGGIVALELWGRHPDLVRSLILADAWAWHPAAAAGLPARLAAIDSTPIADLAAQRMPAVLGPRAEPALVRRAVAAMAAKDPAAYRRSNEVLWAADMRAVAVTVTVPSLVLVGEMDTITPPALAEELARSIPQAALAVIPAAGHLSNEENPEAFNSTLAAFLGETDRR